MADANVISFPSANNGEESTRVGLAAEHYAMFWLLRQGIDAMHVTGQGRYDILVDQGGSFIRIQVKGTVRPRDRNSEGRPDRYRWNISGAGGVHYRNKRPYTAADADLMAFVALDVGLVWFRSVIGCPSLVSVVPHKLAATTTGSWDRALAQHHRSSVVG